jgi:hypothetical protein
VAGIAEVVVEEIRVSIQVIHSTTKIQILTPAVLVDFQILLQEAAQDHLPAEEEVDNANHFYNFGNSSKHFPFSSKHLRCRFSIDQP